MLLSIWQEVANSSGGASTEPGIEGMVVSIVLWLKFAVETIGALIIGVGAVVAAYRFVQTLISPSAKGYHRTRLVLSRFLAIALEFQLAADILGTAVAPSWNQLGQLGAIALIRTFLNYFLGREMKEEEEKIAFSEAQTKEPDGVARAG
jgi:uncharacterized membrane protein